MAAITFALPFPPSTNGLFPGKAKRYCSTAYKAWKAVAAPFVPGRMIEGPYALALVFDRPDRRRRDLSNYLKATEDLLVERGLVVDDSYCEHITLAWSDEPPKRDSVVRVTVTPHSKAAQ